MEESKRTLEASNDSLQEQVRILQTTEADLLHKNNLLQEQVVFLQTDIAELKEANKDSEFRLKSELTSLQAELAAISSHVNDEQPVVATSEETTVEATISEQAQLVEALEIEVEELTGKLTQTEQQNSELHEELNRVAEELLQVHQSHDTLMIEKAQLQNQIAETAALAIAKNNITPASTIDGEAQTERESNGESKESNVVFTLEAPLEEHIKAVESQVKNLSEQLAFVASELMSKTEEMRLIHDEHDSVEAIWLEEKSQYDLTVQSLKREVENQKEAVDILRASLRNHQMEAEVQAGTWNTISPYTTHTFNALYNTPYKRAHSMCPINASFLHTVLLPFRSFFRGYRDTIRGDHCNASCSIGRGPFRSRYYRIISLHHHPTTSWFCYEQCCKEQSSIDSGYEWKWRIHR